LPRTFVNTVTVAVRAVAAARTAARHARQEEVAIPYPASPRLELAGIVYTAILNPFDQRKNWEDLLSAFLLALGDRQDATLVVKLIVCPQLAAAALNNLLQYYRVRAPVHACKLVFVDAYLTDTQMVELASASTYFLNSARAEGSCLPLQNFMAAGRPGVSPVHTALTDYFGREVGFVVDSHPEPACWPHDPGRRFTTRWHRLVWQSLHDQLQASYVTAKERSTGYQILAQRSRDCMTGFASAAAVWPMLKAALDSVKTPGRRSTGAGACPQAA
jgi:hypothetical protein